MGLDVLDDQFRCSRLVGPGMGFLSRFKSVLVRVAGFHHDVCTYVCMVTHGHAYIAREYGSTG